MIVPYNHISELTEAELTQLKLKVMRTPIQNGPVILNGKVLPYSEVIQQKRIWESESNSTTRQVLLG